MYGKVVVETDSEDKVIIAGLARDMINNGEVGTIKEIDINPSTDIRDISGIEE